MVTLLNKKAIEKKITEYHASAKESQAACHELAVQCLYHYLKHGDTTLINKFIEGLPKFIRKADIYRWCLKFGSFDYDVKLGLTHNREKRESITDIDKQVESANETPFYELNKDKEVVQKSFLDILKELEKKISYDLEKRKAPKYSVNDLADIRKLIKARESN